ncbi:MAG: SpoIIE family protein phosphatase [Solirubrobacteraceae bacterium]
MSVPAQALVLVVGDSAEARSARRRTLEPAGFAVAEAATGHDAIATMDERPDVAIVDHDLPDMNSLEVCRRMREHAHGRHLAILQISSARIEPSVQGGAPEGGTDAFLVEPLDPGVLVATTRALLRVRAAEDAAREASDRLGMAQRAARSGGWSYDPRADRMWWSRESLHVMGLPDDDGPADAAGWLELLDAEDRDHLTQALAETLEHGDRWDQEYRINPPGGAPRWMHALGRVDRDERGAAIRLTGMILDVTERRRTQDRLRQLQRATLEMSAAVSVEEVLEAGMSATRDLLEADAVGYGMLEDDGKTVRLGTPGAPALVAGPVPSVPLDRSRPGTAAMLDRRPRRCATLAERVTAFPAADGPDGGDAYEAGAWAPFLTEDAALGFLSAYHHAPRELTADDLALMEAVAQLCSQALVRARLYEQAAAARDAAERAAEQLSLLADVTEALEGERDFPARLQRLLRTLVPRIADFATVEALRPDGRLELLAVHHVDHDQVDVLRRLREQHALDAESGIGLGHVIRTGASELLATIPATMARGVTDPAGRRLLDEIATRSYIGVPLVTGEQTIGGLMLCTSTSGRVYGERDLEIAQELADRVSLVIENARLFDEQRRIARTLQLGLLGGAGTDYRDVTMALRYQPGAGAVEIGGDWYDAFDREDGTMVIVVGDVVGRGLRAATTMAKLRYALRAFALVRDGPAAILNELDRFAQTVEGGVMTTVICAVVDPRTGRTRLAAAGHPPPILVHPDGQAEVVMAGRSMPLVGRDDERPEAELDLPRGATLALYSDGVIERRDESIDDGISRLERLAASLAERPVGVMADSLLDGLLTANVDDDAALLLIRREDPASPVLFRRVPAEPAVLAGLRAGLGGWFRDVGMASEDASDLLLACGEACNNAVEHAYTSMGSGELCLEARMIGEEAHISVRDFGHWRPIALAGDRGRGGMLMVELCDAVDVMRTPTGTMVTLRRRVNVDVPA